MLVKYTLSKIHVLFKCFNKSFVFGVFYRPLASDTRCLEILQKNLEHQTPQADIILVGDFNLKDVDRNNRLMLNISVDYELFSDILSDNFLSQMVLQPTRGNTILDLVLTNNSDVICDTEVGEPIALMYVYVTQANFTTKPRFEIKSKRSFTQMNSQGSRVEKNTHAQKVQMQKILFTTRLVGEIYSSDVIMHRGYFLYNF